MNNEMTLALMGICRGFVFVTMIMHYRNAYHLKKLRLHIRATHKNKS